MRSAVGVGCIGHERADDVGAVAGTTDTLAQILVDDIQNNYLPGTRASWSGQKRRSPTSISRSFACYC
jgi:hypothetical protein